MTQNENPTTDEYATAADLGLMEGFPPPPDKRVTRANALLTPPYNRWSYLNMRTLYPSAGIKAADVAVPLARAIDPAIATLQVRRGESDQDVDWATFLRETYIDAFVVVHGDKIVYEAYSNGMIPHQPHQMMSVTKSFAGLFGLLAVAEGSAKESDLVSQHIPELANAGAFKGATFGHVLDMTNSMDFTEVYDDPESGIRHYGTVLGLMEPMPGRTYANSIYEYLPTLGKDPAHEHGEIFHYQTPKTDVVNWITNRVTGRSFQDDLYDRLWSKLGTDGEAYVLLDKNGTLFAGGGLNAAPNDLARLGLMMINGGQFEGRQVVPQQVIKALADGGDIDSFSNGPESKGFQGNKDWSYRAQWWTRHTPGKEAFTAIGIHGQWIYLDVKRKVAIIKQASQPESATNFYDEYTLNGFDAVISYLANR